MRIETILFDLDGTLIDTNELITESFVYTFDYYGKHFTREEISEFNGPPLFDTFQKVLPGQEEAMIETYREHNFSHHDHLVKPFPHVLNTIHQLKDKGIKLAIVSTKMHKAVGMGLEVSGLDQLFEVIITLDDVTYAKPHPEPVTKAIELLDANAETTLMVGDNYHDIEAGHNAGIQTAGVAWSSKGKVKLQEYNPTYMLEDMRDLLELVK